MQEYQPAEYRKTFQAVKIAFARSKQVSLRFLVIVIGALIVTGVAPIGLLAPRVAIAQMTEAQKKVEADRLFRQGTEQGNTDQLKAAFQSWQQALNLYREIHDRKGEEQALDSLGQIYYYLGAYGKAIEYHEQSLAIAREIKDWLGEGISLKHMALAYIEKKNFAKAIDYMEQFLAIIRKFKDRQSEVGIGVNMSDIEIDTLETLGFIHIGVANYAKSIEYYQQRLAIARELKDRKGESRTLESLGNNYRALGDFVKPLEYYERSLAISREIQDREGEGQALSALGGIYGSLGNYAKALEYYQQSLAIARQVKSRYGEGVELGQVGYAYYFLGNYAKALEYLEQSLAIAREVKVGIFEKSALGDLGRVYSAQGKYAQAVRYYEQSLAIARELQDRQSEGAVLNDLGLIYYDLGNNAQAIESHQQSLAIAREIKDPQAEGAALSNLGKARFKAGTLPQAEQDLFAAIAINETLRANLQDIHKISLADTQQQAYNHLQQVLIAEHKVESALEVAERGRARAFVELLSARIKGTEKVLPQLPETLRLTLSQIQRIAQEHNSTLIQYSIINRKTLYVWVVQPTGKVTHRKVALPQQPSLTALVDASREAIGARGRGNFRIEMANADPSDRLKQLHQLLIAPIADLLPTDPSAQVIFVPHGELFLVPFPALQDAKGQYLIEQHTILTAPAIQVLDLTRQKRQQVNQAGLREVVIVGNPTMPQLTKLGERPEQLKALPSSEQEANRIAALFKTKAWVGAQATKAAIVPKLSQARIIHLATHGLLDDLKGLGTPGAIALAPSGNGEPNDGLLTANEILDLKLNAELVVLSACDTGRGKITSDSVIGLSRSLILAGTPSVMVSLWSVPDASTAGLMTEFYRNWQERKLDKAQALRQAMLTILQRPGATPRDWAAFTLIGESK